MDMNFPTLLSPPHALRRLLDQVMAGRDAVVDGPGASVLLDQAAARLATRRLRVLRAAAAGPDGLSLQELMAQVSDRPDAGNPNDPSLEQGAQALTVLDGRCDGIALLLDDAEAIQPAALRYIQLACHTSAKLRLVLVGMPEGLDGAEFAQLRARLQAQPVLALDGSLPNAVPVPVPVPRAEVQPAPAHPEQQPSVAQRLAAPPSARPKLAAQATPRRTWPAAAALGMAGCVVVGVLATRHVPGQAGGVPAVVPATQPAVPPVAAFDAPVTTTPPLRAVEVPATPGPASVSTAPRLTVTRQAAPEPLPLPPPLPLGRPGIVSRQADARLRTLPLDSDRPIPPRPPRTSSGRLPFSTAQHGNTWNETWADSRDEQRYPPQGWSGGGWQRYGRPWPVPPPSYAGEPYPERGYQYEPWRPANSW